MTLLKIIKADFHCRRSRSPSRNQKHKAIRSVENQTDRKTGDGQGSVTVKIGKTREGYKLMRNS